MAVTIRVSGGLPAGIPVAAEFGPGYINLAVREGLSQQETTSHIAGAWQAIREFYGEAKIALVEAGRLAS